VPLTQKHHNPSTKRRNHALVRKVVIMYADVSILVFFANREKGGSKAEIPLARMGHGFAPGCFSLSVIIHIPESA
jgi:hypothetical protein